MGVRYMDGFYIGNIVGSSYSHEFEKLNKQSKEFDLFTERSAYSDDTILTFATIDWLLHTNHTSQEMIDILKAYYHRYPDKEPTIYGKDYVNWILSDCPNFKKSWSNSGAMRASVIGWYGKTLEEIKDLIEKAISPTHDTLEAKLGAEVVAICVFMMKNNRSKEELKKYIDYTYDYYLDQKLVLLRNSYEFTNDTKETVRPAIIAFLESTSFEDALRNAVSLGGDCDTIANITCSIAEAYYKDIPNSIVDKAKSYLPDEFVELLNELKNAN
jgi:ADP-ribosylglycohydrolase